MGIETIERQVERHRSSAIAQMLRTVGAQHPEIVQALADDSFRLRTEWDGIGVSRVLETCALTIYALTLLLVCVQQAIACDGLQLDKVAIPTPGGFWWMVTVSNLGTNQRATCPGDKDEAIAVLAAYAAYLQGEDKQHG